MFARAASAALAAVPFAAELFELVEELDQTFGINEGSIIFAEAERFATEVMPSAVTAGARAVSTRGPGGTRKMGHLWQVARNFRLNHLYHLLEGWLYFENCYAASCFGEENFRPDARCLRVAV